MAFQVQRELLIELLCAERAFKLALKYWESFLLNGLLSTERGVKWIFEYWEYF